MRDIRFRAWDKKEKYMRRFDKMELGISDDAYHVCLMCEDVATHGTLEWAWERNKSIEIMQFTGLKDKTGREIYEGDIVTGEPPIYTTKVIGVVKYGALAFSFIGRAEDGEKWYDTITNPSINKADVKVIGNIYENPELLKHE